MQLAEGNFLLPTAGTFITCLIIFLIVLGVIWFFVAPSIQQVLDDREKMINQTANDGRAAAKGFEDAEAEYRAGLASARGEAGSIRDEARASGRAALEEQKQRASAEADAITREKTEQLRAAGESAAAAARADLAPLSASLASRVLGFDVTQDPALKTKLDQITSEKVVKN
ncbi:ATP synthase subunit b OS=Tsukamurella paurometabola (strain ATCC 8368 / DSM / CCUG 35730 /CIP 100753 / JCM 10117 / KCTC 9821 / NBRC 16120 / NCIMB 702349/ NCTC 13040) OX=521096 GN=atpF PE=3 SV=1 [Tsukamurella paurometabola]|uniref:ATP synthase subunit b n=1 Tax=Tsukamurella paurometabola (strain ATCC 8368 / DSM 20162 / CCUG 35730 / CIP 100753 / JCM 10117 / KCTC 9821 / NBRC 16120 / NCIMB 702349 / NCTC 13040) TaxID=521096 RepID=D5UW75_TSUPD|nr:F0F1 ATP synthase subunit B [Tsukamurella paurometabola]ADG77882.1 H+transporting two-sector ATPase B/B' subunit [Tsukamurella paurometabola DSM 20162]SUP29193.1 F-type ATPase subunit b [Tsukamurella paurometabola]